MMARYAEDDASVVVVVGSGAGGGTLSNELAQKGIDVVCLEAGRRLTLADVVNDPGVMQQRMGWNDPRKGAPVNNCKTVGGTTMRWSAIAPRFEAFEFAPRTTYGKLENTTSIDWPMAAEEMVPWYERAELKMGVSGTHGIPPSAETNAYKLLKAGARKLGYRRFTSGRTAINPVPRDGRPACRQLGFCWSGCAIGAKWSTMYTEIPFAERSGHFELRPESMALRIELDKKGRVTGVVYADSAGELRKQKARAVCVAGNVVETTRLLLNSASQQHPDGLGNHAGHLGRNYMRHMTFSTVGIMPGEVNYHRGTRQSGLLYDELLHDAGRGFAGGYLIETIGADPVTSAFIVAPWGRDAAEYMENFKRLGGAWVTGEDPPQASNCITLDDSERDAYGLPVPVVHYEFHPNSLAMYEHGRRQCEALVEALGGIKPVSALGAGGGAHNMGTARMSAKPEDGVCDRWGQVHGIPNLFVSDGSAFPSSAAANPTLTIVALAMRQSDRIAARMTEKTL